MDHVNVSVSLLCNLITALVLRLLIKIFPEAGLRFALSKGIWQLLGLKKKLEQRNGSRIKEIFSSNGDYTVIKCLNNQEFIL